MKSKKWIEAVENRYGVTYVGFYDIPNRDNVYVFYQENPKTELGHSHYMGVFFDLDNTPWVTNAKSITEAVYPAIQLKDGSFIVSRYRHNFVEKDGKFIDGGLAYTRSNTSSNAYMKVIDGKEIFYAGNPPAQRG